MSERDLNSTVERNAWLAQTFPSAAPFRKIDLTQFPSITWNDGTSAPVAAIAALLRSDQTEVAFDRDNLLREIDPESANSLLVKIIPLLGSARRDLDDAIYAIIEYWGDGKSLKLLGDAARSQLKQGKNARVLDALATLSRCRNSDSAIAEIDSIVQHATTPAVREAAMNALLSQLEGKSRSFRDVRDQFVPSLGFDVRGPKIIELGSQRISARVLGDFSLELRNEKGKEIKSIPAVRKGDDGVSREQAAAWLSATRKELKQFAGDQAARLEEAMIADLTWPVPVWKSRYLERPLLAQLGRRILWTAKRNPLDAGDVFRIAEDYTLADGQDNEFHLDETMYVSIAYPLGWNDSQRSLWTTILEDYAVTPLFSQSDREVFAPVEEEYRSNSVSRFFGCRVDHRSLKNRFKRAGWNIGRFRDSFPWCLFHFRDFLPDEQSLRSMPNKSLHQRTIRAICFHDRLLASTDYTQELSVSLAHAAFARANEIDLKDARATLERMEAGSCFLPIVDVPPRVFSETIRDIVRLSGHALEP